MESGRQRLIPNPRVSKYRLLANPLEVPVGHYALRLRTRRASSEPKMAMALGREHGAQESKSYRALLLT
jgi:hypothetical protein